MARQDLREIIKSVLEEKTKRDRCLRIADRKFDKPSAYKSGAVVRCRQGKIWKDLKEDLLTEYSDKIITQLTTKFKSEKPDLDDNIITAYIKRFSQIKDSNNVSQKDIMKYTWNDLEKVISDNQPKRIKAGKLNDGEPSKDANLVYNQNNLRIYVGPTKEACVKYGNGYSFCISARGGSNMYSQYRIENFGTPYFVFDDTKTSKQSSPGKFEDPNHLLVVFVYNPEDYEEGGGLSEGYTITNADNSGEDYFESFNGVERYYPRLKGLENIFQPIEVNPKEKAEYDIELKYNDALLDVKRSYKKDINIDDFQFTKIGLANGNIDNLINGKTQVYKIDALLKPEAAQVNYEKYGITAIYQYRFIKSNENIDDARQDFIEDILIPGSYNATLEDILNDWEIRLIKLENPVYKQYFQDVKKLVDEYRGEIAKLKLLKENLSKIIKEIIQEDESLHKWFKRQGPSGKEGGWVDCNTCRTVDGKKKCKSCGRKEGEKRSKYPSCRPTPSQCGKPGKGKTWGKTK